MTLAQSSRVDTLIAMAQVCPARVLMQYLACIIWDHGYKEYGTPIGLSRKVRLVPNPARSLTKTSSHIWQQHDLPNIELCRLRLSTQWMQKLHRGSIFVICAVPHFQLSGHRGGNTSARGRLVAATQGPFGNITDDVLQP